MCRCAAPAARLHPLNSLHYTRARLHSCWRTRARDLTNLPYVALACGFFFGFVWCLVSHICMTHARLCMLMPRRGAAITDKPDSEGSAIASTGKATGAAAAVDG